MKRSLIYFVLISFILPAGMGVRIAQTAELIAPDLILEPVEPFPIIQPIPLEPITVEPTPTCESIIQEAIKLEMPAVVGNPFEINRLLQVTKHDWRARINVPSLFNVIEDQFATGATLPDNSSIGKLIGEQVLLRRDADSKASSLSYNLPRGEARYLNPQRMMPLEGGVAIDEQKGMEVVRQTIDSLGLSPDEVDLEGMQSNILRAGIVEGLQAKLEQAKVMDIERTYFIPRQVNGIPVEGSFLAVGVTNQGELSRFRVKWPLLELTQTQAESVVAMEEMQQRVSEKMLNAAPECQKEPEAFTMRVAYVPGEMADGDESDGRNIESQAVAYKLQMVVHYIPGAVEAGREESGSIMHFDLY